MSISERHLQIARDLCIAGPVGDSDGSTYCLKTPSVDDLAKAFAAERIAGLEEARELVAWYYGLAGPRATITAIDARIAALKNGEG